MTDSLEERAAKVRLIEAEIEKIVAGLSEAQRRVVHNPVRGVIAGQFFCASTPDVIDELTAMGLCKQRFEPGDFAARGYKHAARATDAGLAAHRHLRDNCK